MGKGSEIIEAMNKPWVKLIESVSGALGKLYEPHYLKKMADARAYEIKTIGQAMQESSCIPFKYESGEIAASTENFEDLKLRTQNRLDYQELQKQLNIESVTLKACHVLEEETECSPEPVSKDWMIRFFNSVEDISDEDMQELWARILAGEVKHPKTFSLRTLETLKNLSKEEALVFEKVCRYKITDEDIYFPKYLMWDEVEEIIYNELILLEECGLLKILPNIVSEKRFDYEGQTVVAKNDNLEIVAYASRQDIKKLSIDIYPFTKTGIEISNLFHKDILDENLIIFAKALKRYMKNEARIAVYRKDDIERTDNLLNR